MSETPKDSHVVPRGLSRRDALRAGVAVGVGAAAWSGASITSLGGTPAYAAGCTGAVPPIPLTADAGCRNLDCGGSGPYRFHDALKSGSFSSDGYTFSLSPEIGENTPCEDNTVTNFTFPNTLDCQVVISYWSSQTACTNGATPDASVAFPPNSLTNTSPIAVTMGCTDGVDCNAWKFTVTANCSTHGTGDPSCF